MNVTRRIASTALAALALAGCVTRPAALYGADGEDTVRVQQLELRDAADRRVPVRIAYPASGTALPVVLFSHGAYSSKDDYAPLLDHWAAHGYVVIAPTHPDSTKLGMQRGDPAAGRMWPVRVADLRLVVARLAEIEQRVPDLAGRIDTTRIAAAGHSYGGLVAQTLGGATRYDPASNATVTSGREPRVAAVIVFSGAGRMAPTLRADDWQGLKVPTLVTVGTNDLEQAPDRTGYEWRREPFDLAPPGDKYLLVLRDADHYLGGTVGRDDLARSPNGAAYLGEFNATAVAFLDAYLKKDARARRFLARDTVGTFGRLERK